MGPVSYAGVRGDVINGARQVASILSPDYDLSTKALVTRAHRLGLKVIPWTVNDPAAMNAQIDLGVDGLITDYPTRLRTILRERGMPLPAPVR